MLADAARPPRRLTTVLLAALALGITSPALSQDGADWDVAHARLLAEPPDGIGAAIARWRMLVNGAPSFDAAAGFLIAYPGFPEEARLRLAAEAALIREAIDRRQVVGFCDRFPPLGNAARGRYALALASLGRPEAATVARAAWRGGAMAPGDAAAIMARWGAGFTSADYDARLEALLSAGDTADAAAVLGYASPTARTIAQARIALAQGRDPEAAPADSLVTPDGLITQGGLVTPGGVLPPGIAPPAPVTYGAPALLHTDPGYLIERARFLMRRGASAAAGELIATHPPLSHPASDPHGWISTLLALARAQTTAPDVLSAERVTRIAEAAAAGFAPGVDLSTRGFAIRDDATSLAWLGASAALWQLRDGPRASRLFLAYAHAARTPQTRAKGYYWAGRAIDGPAWRVPPVGLPGAEADFAAAAQYPDQYHGLLALERLHRPIPALTDPPPPALSPAERAAFYARPLTRAVREVARDTDWATSVRFFRALADQAQSPRDAALAAEAARVFGRRDLGVIVGQAAANNGIGGLRGVAFPLLALYPGADWTFIHAIARQESQFSPNAVSAAGAYGLMQMLPSTAAGTARALALAYPPGALMHDTGFNERVGEGYFHALLARFDGSYPLAIAAYNAGPGNVARWLRDNGDPRTGAIDGIDWIERIPFAETRAYVEHVLENAVVYEVLYPAHAAYHGPNPLSHYLGRRMEG